VNSEWEISINIICKLRAKEEEENVEAEDEKYKMLQFQWKEPMFIDIAKQSNEVTYPCCKFGFEYAFKQRD